MDRDLLNQRSFRIDMLPLLLTIRFSLAQSSTADPQNYFEAHRAADEALLAND